MIKTELEALFAGLTFLAAGHFPWGRSDATVICVGLAVIAFAVGLVLVVSGAK